MNWSNKTIIAFDLGYTLVTNDRVKHYHQYLKEKNIDMNVSEVEQAFHLIDKKFMREYPKVISTGWNAYFPWFLGLVNFHLKLTFDLVEQCEFIKQAAVKQGPPFWKPFPWTFEVLAALQARSYQLALLSNWDHSARPILGNLGLTDYFETIIISDEFGCEKPDVEIFRELLRQTGSPPENILYVGDNYYDDAVGALQAGIDTVILNPYERIGIEETDHPHVVNSIRDLLTLLPAREEEGHVHQHR
ncbi:HAD family hydrolase [Paenibacillus sp. FSL M8-0334]|uniref:HAD family hydrolase n=1 Tax=Paenibacillus sp. FSL M8-0334 TaxID=2921623 RepID=UPI0030F85618